MYVNSNVDRLDYRILVLGTPLSGLCATYVYHLSQYGLVVVEYVGPILELVLLRLGMKGCGWGMECCHGWGMEGKVWGMVGNCKI